MTPSVFISQILNRWLLVYYELVECLLFTFVCYVVFNVSILVFSL
jgi:hypothetical protein